jgi:hypothetical protein
MASVSRTIMGRIGDAVETMKEERLASQSVLLALLALHALHDPPSPSETRVPAAASSRSA